MLRRLYTSVSRRFRTVELHSRRSHGAINPKKNFDNRIFRAASYSSLAESSDTFIPEDDAEEVDFCVIGGGPSGLSFSIRLMQNSKKDGRNVRVVLIEKAASIGNHNLSGAVLDPRALNELFPSWPEMDSPVKTKVSMNKMLYLTRNHSLPLPHPPDLSNRGNYIISISALCSWLAERAEELGVEIYTGFSGSKLIYDKQNRVRGVSTNDFGVGKDGKPNSNFVKGLSIIAKATIISEGCRGSLSKKVIERFSLDKNSNQTYGIGLKEVWEIPKENYVDGLVLHSVGWPGKSEYYGGGFMYHFDRNKCSVGYVIGLDYKNPTISPYNEFQLLKTHPVISKYLHGGKVINYGARALNEGGFQGIPELVFPGGALIGCSAGFLDVMKIKGIHTAMGSGIICADVAYNELKKMEKTQALLDLSGYQESFEKSWIRDDLWKSRNIRPSFSRLGLLGGLIYSGIDNMILRGNAPWTFKIRGKDHKSTKPLRDVNVRQYSKPDGKITFPLLENLSRSGTNHAEDQPCHLKLKNGPEIHLKCNYKVFGGLEQLYCPAGVYEYIKDDTNPHGVRLQINSQNCIHCKTCDIKDPTQNISWQTPQGGDGPRWSST